MERCLQSLVIAQEQMEVLEVLVLNDGSKDRSSEIGHSFQDQYPNTFRVIDKENGNYGSCVNRGLKEAKGKYIKVLDADDWFDTTVFSNYLEFLASVDVDAVVSDFVEVNEQGEITKQHTYAIPQGIWKLSDLPQCQDMWMHAIAYKTDNLRAIGYTQTEGISYTDQEWIFWPMVTVKSVVGFSGILYQYLVGRQGQTVDVAVKAKNIWQEIKSFKAMLDTMSQLTDYGDAKDYMQFRLLGRAQYIYKFVLLNANSSSKELLELDKHLCTNYKELYNQLDFLVPREDMRIRYIHQWRKSRNVSLVRTLWRIEKGIRKLTRYIKL